jgi:multidrug efflux pump subunit AcrA (membrane-fusion protein)
VTYVLRSLAALLLVLGASVPGFGQEIEVPNVLVKLIDELDVPAPEAGTVIAAAAQEGQTVAAGDLLVQIDDAEARYVLARAKLELAIARDKAASDVAVRGAERASQTAATELERAEDARSRLRATLTETELDRLRLAADQGALAVEKARQEQQAAQLQQELKQVELEFAQQQVERRRVTALFAGKVVDVHVRRGAWVEPGDKLLRVVRLDRLRVEGMLDARAGGLKQQGQSVSLQVDLPGGKATSFPGKLTFVSPVIDPFTKQVRVLAEIENPDLVLQPGLRGTLKIAPAR